LRHASALYDSALAAKLGPSPPTLIEAYHTIVLRDGHRSTLKIIKPANKAPGPLIVIFFSGAFLAGSIEQTSQLARALATLYSATVVSVSYRLAPEAPFPTGVFDAIDGVTWVADHATGQLISANPSMGFILGGASSGANLAAVLSRYFQKPEKALKWKITGQWMSAGQLFPDVYSVPTRYRSYWVSQWQNAMAPVLNVAALDQGERALRSDPTSELRFPVNSYTDMKDQPPTYLQSCGMDPLRDDTLVYEEMLKEQGVLTRLDLYPGCPHAFWLVVPGEKKSKKAMQDLMGGVGWLLGRDATNSSDVDRALGIAV
jgi:acetyl esterase/lipase